MCIVNKHADVTHSTEVNPAPSPQYQCVSAALLIFDEHG